MNNSKIVKVRRNIYGDITDIILEDGVIYSANEAIVIAKSGMLEGINIKEAENGREYIDSIKHNDILNANVLLY